MEYVHELRIPKNRIAVVIGKNGKTKKELEEYSNTNINVDSKEGVISVKGKDAVKLFFSKEMIKAIGRGFSPEVAKQLLKQDYSMEIISLNDFSDKKKQLERVRGRVIGKKGKSREIIEKLTETNISIYGKTISIIGRSENVGIARNSVEMLLDGATHSSVYKKLESFRRQMKMQEMTKI
ncbi:RNA-processing protein [Candidatus Woesearchaeota archaeon]|jgi:ribosomal RNA assembly protein|nr:RNA-processing protein [Candidatus Woesearchaeota archaeon]|tara:strand:- start:496 stop:1035 length:540 start_codon:yes stop_codon:yes gene_type:complete